MDARAKQRLTGAVILVALFVLLVPELLTGPHPSSGPADSENVPNLKKFTIDIDDKSKPSGASSSSAADAAVSLPAVSPSPAPNSQARALPGEAAAPPSDTTSHTPAPTPQAASSPMSAAATKPSTTATVTTPAPAPVAPTPTAPPASAPHTDASRPAASERGAFVVQLGSFGSRDNANRLVRDMTAKGFKAFVAPITTNGRELYRVRVGPAPSRVEAESLAAQLKRLGQSGSIVPIS